MKVEIKYLGGAIDVLKNVVSVKPMEEAMDFSEAVKALKMGNKVRRIGWDTKESLCFRKTHPQLFSGNEIQQTKWKPTIDDLEATDWWIVTD